MLLLDDPFDLAAFDGLCRRIAQRGHGITSIQLRAVHALALELGQPHPDTGKVETLRRELGLPVSFAQGDLLDVA